MKKLKAALLEGDVKNPDKVLRIVEEVLGESLKDLNDQASILCEKHDGASDLVHYYAGQGVGYMNVAEDLGMVVEWRPKRSYDDYRT